VDLGRTFCDWVSRFDNKLSAIKRNPTVRCRLWSNSQLLPFLLYLFPDRSMIDVGFKPPDVDIVSPVWGC
jgi:hypothetical protein